jgi:hypothetical protein
VGEKNGARREAGLGELLEEAEALEIRFGPPGLGPDHATEGLGAECLGGTVEGERYVAPV